MKMDDSIFSMLEEAATKVSDGDYYARKVRCCHQKNERSLN